MKETFLEKNKVFLIGLLSAVAVALTPFVQTGNTGDLVKWSTVGFAAAIAVLSYVGNAWRGQGTTILGIAGNAAAVMGSLLAQGSSIKDGQFILQLVIQTLIAVSMAAQSDPKSRGYEHTDTIKQAKKEGEEIKPAQLTSRPKD